MNGLRQIPPVNEILAREELSDLRRVLGQPFVTKLLNEVLGGVRKRVQAGAGAESRSELAGLIALDLRGRIESFLRPSLKRVINASGVIVHTNLGRAPLPEAALDYLKDICAGYSNLEFDLDRGRRGRRGAHVSDLINQLLGSEAALVVNNNAAAVLLVLNSLAEGGEVVVSRGEEVEIGGSFRIPEVMVKSGARLREVGTTNRTRIDDYRAAAGPRTRLFLRVHPSNFRVVGFTERPSLEEFAGLGRTLGVPTFEDIGSGCLTTETRSAIGAEPLAKDSLRAGVDVVCFSGDKLMGGPQAGIVAGRKEYVDRIGRNPLYRALRVDKLTLAVLESVLLTHLRGALAEVPVLRMLMTEEGRLRDRSELLVRRAGIAGLTSVSLRSVVGGGSVPEVEIPSWGLALAAAGLSASELESRFRGAAPPVLVRIEDDRILIDLRTVFTDEDEVLIRVIREVIA